MAPPARLPQSLALDDIASIWADSGDRMTPEQLGIVRSTGFGAAYSLPGGETPSRQLFNDTWYRLTSMAVEVNRSGVLPYDDGVDYSSEAAVTAGTAVYLANATNGPNTTLGIVSPLTVGQTTWATIATLDDITAANIDGVLGVTSGGTGVTSYAALETALNIAPDTGPVTASRRRNAVDAQSGSYTLLPADEGKTLLWDTSSTGGNAGLPDLTASENGWRVRFIKGDAANTLILTPNSGDMIEGATTYTINAQNEIVDVVWTGTTWEITSHDYNRPLPLSAGGLGASSASGGRSTLGLGTAATEDAGTASGDVALLGSSGVFSQDRIPTLSASKVPNLQSLNGILDVASGGTGVTSYTALEAALNLGSDTGPVLAIRRRDTVDPQSGSYTLLAADEGKTLLWDTSSGGGNAGLPDLVSSENGWRARFIKGDAANTLILTPDGSDMIEGASTFTINAQNEIIDVVWTGTTWEIISHTHVRPLPLMAGGLGASTAMGGRSTLGLGTAAVVNTGNSSGNVALLGSGGQFATGRIPNLSASKITSGTMPEAQLPVRPIAGGGTGATNVSAARSALGLGSAAVEDVGTSSGDLAELGSGGVFSQDRIPNLSAGKLPNLQSLNGTLDIASGGTNSTTVTAARSALGLGSAAVEDAGVASGDLAELGSGGRFHVNRIPNLQDLNGLLTASQLPAGVVRRDILINTDTTIPNTGVAQSLTVSSFGASAYRWIEAVYRIAGTRFVDKLIATELVQNFPQTITDPLAAYAINDTNDALYRVDVTAGTAARVHATNTLGTGSWQAAFVLNGMAYAINDFNEALYRVDVTAGTATRVHASNTLGTGEWNAAFTFNGVAYAINDTNEALYRVDVTAGTAARVHASNTIGTGNWDAAFVLNGVAYVTNDTNDALYRVDVTAGTAARVHATNTLGAGSIGRRRSRLAVWPTQSTTSNNSLYEVDVTEWHRCRASAIPTSAGETGQAAFSGQGTITINEPPEGMYVPDANRLTLWRNGSDPNTRVRMSLVDGQADVVVEQLIGIT